MTTTCRARADRLARIRRAVDEVQERYGVTVGDVDITEENFGSVSAIVRFVAARRGT